MTYIGWLGSVLFALCGLPQAIQSYKQKHSNGLTWMFLLMWFFGEVFTFAYVLPKMDYPLLANYVVNFAFLIVIIWFKLFPKRSI